MYHSARTIWFLVAVAVCFALAAFTPAARAQAVYGSIFGTVSDASGAAVPNAKILITDNNKGTRFETTTNTDGNYSKGQLLPGDYQVEVEAAGFQKAVFKSTLVKVDAAARLNVKLEVGNVATEVEVTAEAPLLKSDRSDVSTSFSAMQLSELPSFGRNFQNYLLLTPGTQKIGWQHASSENPQGSAQIQVNGQHFSGTGYQLDGTDNQDPILGIIVINPTLESVTEAKITSQNYDAEFGLATSGIVNTSTKSGTNGLHGSAFDYIQNNTPGFSTFARNPFNSAEDRQVPPLQSNIFGGSAGGALRKNKIFAFADIQETRRRRGSSVLTQVPTLKARGGDFSEYPEPGRNTIFDPLTGSPSTGVGRVPFANNTLPSSRISPQALALLKFVPSPNAVDRGGSPFRRNYAATGGEKFDANQWNTRLDWFINDKSSLFGRYSWASFNKFAPGAYGELAGGAALDNINFAGVSDVRNQSLAAGYNYTFSPTLLSELRVGFMRYRVNVLPNGLGTSPAKDAGIPGLNLDNFFTSGMPGLFIQGDGGFNFGYSLGTNQCNCPLDQQEQQFQIVNNTTKINGNHTVKFGADIRFATNLRVPSDSHRSGELSFGPGYTGTVAAAGAGVQQGLGLATFLLGQTTFFKRYVSPNTDARERQRRFFWYGQDTWRVNPKLTLNYGLRWEMIFPETVNAAGNGGQLDLRTGEIAVFGVGGVSGHGIQEMKWSNFAPRLGVTYQVTPKTVVRAGYGWSYALGTFGSIFGHNVTQNLPVLAIQEMNRANDFSGVFTLAQGPVQPTFPKPDSNGRFKLPDGVSGKARPENLRMPRVMAHNITIQHQLTKTLVAEIGYVGNVGRHQFAGDGPNHNANQAAFVPGVTDSNVRKPFFQRFGWTQGIDFYCNCANSTYNSLQAKLDRRFSKGYGVTANYTYQVAKQDSGDSFTFLYNRALGWGDKDWLSHHTMVIAQNWDVPYGKGRQFGGQIGRLPDAVLGGWAFNAISTFYGGLPFTPGFDAPSGAIRPNAGPGGRPDVGSKDPFEGAKKNRDQWYVGGLGGAFLVPANNQFGNYPINGLRGPRFYQQDLSMAKTFKATERINLNLRAEAFNVWNHTNLDLPNGNVTSGDAGRINGLWNNTQMRRLQFGLRIGF
ncbi:MAG: TonB-dependent receptor [Acidobacteria bacterium]|nr:TonB-dependent receptor [Acidobacteriota bacterium]